MKALSEFIIRDTGSAELVDNLRPDSSGGLEMRPGSRLAATLPGTIRCMMKKPDDLTGSFYVVAGNKLCSLEKSGDNYVTTELGTLSGAAFSSDSEQMTMFVFKDNIYILGGGKYYRYDGTSVTAVEGYVPLIRRYACPTVEKYGTPYESENMLTPKVRMRFQPDSMTRDFYLLGKVKSVDRIVVNTFDNSDCTVTLDGENTYITTPATFTYSERDLIEVWYTLDRPDYDITTCTRAAVMNFGSDTRVFLYGGEKPSKMYPCEPAGADTGRKPSCEYFPIGSEITVGSAESIVTATMKQRNRMLIFTEDEIFCATKTDGEPVNGFDRAAFPISTLNSQIGSCKAGPLTVDGENYVLNEQGLFRIFESEVRDELVGERISVSDRIGLDADFAENCRAFAYARQGELWFHHGGLTVIFDTRNRRFCRYLGITPGQILELGGDIAYTSANKLCVFDETLTTDLGVAVVAELDTGYIDLGRTIGLKNLYRVGVELSAPDGAKLIVTLSDEHGCTHSFGIDCDSSDAPVVFDAHARLGRAHHFRLNLKSAPSSGKFTLKAVKLLYR